MVLVTVQSHVTVIVIATVIAMVIAIVMLRVSMYGYANGTLTATVLAYSTPGGSVYASCLSIQ